jgi:maltoporin
LHLGEVMVSKSIPKDKLPIVLMFLSAIMPAFAFGLESHGYFRSGLGWSKNGTNQVCFRAPGTEGHSGTHRLGNECQTYIEWSVSENYAENGPTKFRSHIRISMESRGHREFEDTRPGWDGQAETLIPAPADFALREAFVEAIQPQKWPFTLWAGKRFYQRIDLHMLDAFIFANTGPGVGIENIPAPFAGKLHFAITHNIPYAAHEDRAGQSNLDLRWADLPIGTRGTIMPFLIYGQSSAHGHATGEEKWEALSGWQSGFFYRQPFGQDFHNLVSLQYGVGLFGSITDWHSTALDQFGAWSSAGIARGNTDAKEHRNQSWSLRIAEQLVLNSKGRHSFEALLMLQMASFGGAPKSPTDSTPMKDKRETTAGLRHLLQFAPNFSFATEIGTTVVENTRVGNPAENPEYPTVRLQKLTFAPQWSPEMGYWSRPQLRLFTTFAKWNDAAKGLIGAPVFGNDKSGWSAGAQVETWW